MPTPRLPRVPLARPRLPRLPRGVLSTVVGTSALAVLAAGAVVTANQDTSEASMGPVLTATPLMPTQVFGAPSEPAVPDVIVTAEADQRAPASIDPALTLRPLASRLAPDVVVTRATSFSPQAVQRLAGLAKGGTALPYRAGRVALAGSSVATAGVDPAQFRQFAAKGTAEATAVWQAVARGEVVASHGAAKRLGLVLGDTVKVRALKGGPTLPLRLGALATTGLPSTDLVVDEALSRQLALPDDSGLILATGKGGDPIQLANAVREITGDSATVDLLAPPKQNPTAFLTGGAAAQAFGAFSYRYFPDGSIAPDQAWVNANIRNATVPIVGNVRCHKIMLVQLRGALEELVARGLGDLITTYNGCYVPRFIASDPSRPISLHTWGIAIDFDAATNYRGIRGTMDMRVVEVFKRWGFRWGGDWNYTDPMHFELGAILQSPPS